MRTSRPLIIDGRQTPNKRWVEYLITFSGWLVLITSVIQVMGSGVLWVIGIRYFHTFLDGRFRRESRQYEDS